MGATRCGYGVIWTVIYALNAIAAVAMWRASQSRRALETVVGLFALNGFLNILWSLLFFRLLLPYLGRVSIALTLDISVVRLNGPFA